MQGIIRWLIVGMVLLVACTPASSDLTPIAAVQDATPTRLAQAGPPPTATPTDPPTPASPTVTPAPSATVPPPATRTPLPAEAAAPTITAIPSPLPALPDTPDTQVFLLIGTDSTALNRISRTDAILLVALHPAAGAATLLALPRDLLVYIPTRGMDRLNTAYPHGAQTDYPGGGAALLRDTIAYNLGIHAPVYARVDFSGFEALIDALDGVTVTVACPLQDWALQPGGNPNNEEDWAMLTLPAGVHQLDGRTALWYVRSRRTSSDLDRGRRQQDVLRAIGQAAQAQGWLAALPGLWDALITSVDTNLTLDHALSLVPAVNTLDPARIDRLMLRRAVHYTAWVTPGGESVLLPVGDALADLAANFVQPPTENRLVLGGASVAIINHSGRSGMAQVAAGRLAWEGIAATVDDSGGGAQQAATTIIDFTGRTKDSPLAVLQAALGVPDDRVEVRPTRDREVDFRVALGADYAPCVYGVLPPE
jgi:LCP family protein required for cell wall assembly